MKKTTTQLLAISASLFIAGGASAKPSVSLDTCMTFDGRDILVNADCVSKLIADDPEFKSAERVIVDSAAVHSAEYATATLRFYPKEMRIDVVAHRDPKN